MKKNPIEQIHSSIYDKVVKSLTLFFMTLSLLITIGMDIIHGVVDFHSNQNEYQAQNATVSYISDNLLNSPIKEYQYQYNSVFFRDLECDSSEEEQLLFPYQDQNITRWYQQLICVTRFQEIKLSTTCSQTEYNCGPYCIGTSEGSLCPISKLTIIQNEVIDEDADQNLESNRDLYIQRDNSSFGIFKIQVVIRGYPCLNPLLFITAGLTNNTDYIDPENCDGTDYDTDNSVQIEQTTLSNFAKQGLEALGYNGVPSSVIDSAITYLTARNKIESSIDDRCTQVDNQMIYDTENCVSSIEQIGFIYVIIKEIFTGFIILILIIEMIILKCRIVNDIRIITVIFKVFIICQMSFIMIEGGLILYQEQLRKDAQQYFWSIYKCYTSEQIMNFFANFPNLFSADVTIYVSLTRISIIIIGISEFILSMMFIVQMFHWCFHEKKKVKQAIYEQEKLTSTQPQNIYTQNYNPQQYNPQSELKNSQHSFPRQHSQTDPYQQPIQANPQNYPPPSGYGPPKLADSYIPPVDLVSQVVLGKKNSKY